MTLSIKLRGVDQPIDRRARDRIICGQTSTIE